MLNLIYLSLKQILLVLVYIPKGIKRSIVSNKAFFSVLVFINFQVGTHQKFVLIFNTEISVLQTYIFL